MAINHLLSSSHLAACGVPPWLRREQSLHQKESVITMSARSRALPTFASMLVAAASLASGAPVLAAPGGSSTSIAVTSDPTSVSVSRVDGPTFYVKYTVTVTNNSSNNT